MKNIPLLVLSASLALCGCATTSPTSPTTAARVQSAAKVAAYVGTVEYLKENPKALSGFIAARDALKTIEEADTVDFATLLAIVQKLPVKELKTENAQLIVTSATILLSDYAGSLPVERLAELKPVAKAIREGIDLALAQLSKDSAWDFLIKRWTMLNEIDWEATQELRNGFGTYAVTGFVIKH